MKYTKKTILLILLLALFTNACATPAETLTAAIPTSNVVSPQLSQDALLFSGPDNRSFQVISRLSAGETLLPIGTYRDFVKVDVSSHGIGFVHKDLVGNLPNSLPEFAIVDVPWIPVDVRGYFESEITTITNNAIIIENNQGNGFGWVGVNTKLNSPFRIKMGLELQDLQAGFSNIQLIGAPYGSQPNEWWQGLISIEISINAQGFLRFCIRDGTSEDCAYNQTTTIQNGQLFSLVFDDLQGRVFHLLDQQGAILLTINTNENLELTLPDGLFPSQNLWFGAWISPNVTLTIPALTFEKEPSGRWNPNVDIAVYSPISPEIFIEEKFIDFVIPENGAGPLWNRGASVIVRQDDDVFISMIETQPEWTQPNNVKCNLYQRVSNTWQVKMELNDPTREPCPIASDGSNLYISTNHSLGGNSLPEIVVVNKSVFWGEPALLTPEWEEGYNFTAWSYRGIGMDVNNNELLLLNISDNYGYYWTFLEQDGQWSRKGILKFPKARDGVGILRLAYPNTVINNRSAYIMTVSDVIEPDNEYLSYMIERGIGFHYVFRQLYYSWTPDVTQQNPSDWVLLASAEPYGHITNQDIWMAEDGTTHFLWIEESIDSRLEDYLPEVPDTQTLWRAVLKDGEIISRTALTEYDSKEMRPNHARFHSLPNGRLLVIVSGYENTGGVGNRLLELYKDGTHSEAFNLDLNEPLSVFQVASQQNGSSPSNYIDIIGATKWDATSLNYVRIKLEQP